MQLLESLVKGLLPEADLASNDEMRQLGSSLGILMPAEVSDASSVERGMPKLTNAAGEDIMPLIPDQQGHVQYTGPASSFSFHFKLRSLFENYSAQQHFVLFGKNATEEETLDLSSGPSQNMPLPYNDRHYDANEDIPNQVTESGFDVRVTDDMVTA